jgi:mycothiol synthase
MKLSVRMYRGDEDYWKIRSFLREVFLCNGRRQPSWDVVRFDYWRWHGVENLMKRPLEEIVTIWETSDGRIAAVLNPESQGDAYLQVHPDLRSLALEEEMLAAAEENLSAKNHTGRRSLTVWALQNDPLRRDLLLSRGYIRGEDTECQRQLRLDVPIPEPSIAPGYSVRSMGDGAELLERCYASGLGFHPDNIQYAVDNRKDVSWYRNIQNAPLYRRDLDIVAVAPDGAVASFCTVWFDDVTRSAVLEPVATVPDHQRRGLGKAVIFEGLRRVRRMGATLALVSSYSLQAGALYESAGLKEADLNNAWMKEF